ncbi:MAG: MiaB/RimO family radical SAM methylthiotransferase, partial [Eubacterium sp.]
MKAAFHTLGCKVNQYETESMKEQFAKAGFTIVDEEEKADVYVVNTCTVTNLADRKSRQFIRRCRKVNPDAVVAVTGCYAQIKPEEVAEIEGVQIVAGTDEKHAVLPLVQEYFAARKDAQNPEDAENGGVLSAVKDYSDLNTYEEMGEISGMEGRTRAFIKIQEGCTHFCTYCIIPYARGTIRSRRKEEIREEVQRLVAKGYKEIVLTGINTAYYGRDLGYDGAAELIGELNSIPGNFRIRLSSLEPTVIDAEYVKKLFPYEKLCHHLHLALQSGSNQVLDAMNRGYSREEFL